MAQVVVIGAGFGGLAAAIRLQAGGLQVTLVEAREQPGGRAGQLCEAGYTFDMGPTIITAPRLLEDLWRAAGRDLHADVGLVPLHPYYQVRFRDGTRFEYGSSVTVATHGAHRPDTSGISPALRVGPWANDVAPEPGPGSIEAEIARLSPADLPGYRRFLADTEQIYVRAFAQLGRQPFLSWQDFARVAPELLRLGAHRSVYSFVSRYVQDEHLRVILSFHPLFIGGNPFRASAIYSIVPYLEQQGGVWFARGGMHAVVDAMSRLFRRLGGVTSYGDPVVRIVQRNGRVAGVRLAGGAEIRADAVVSNADVAATYGQLLGAPAPVRHVGRRLDRLTYSMSCFLLYLGLDRQYPELRHHTILMPRDYRGVVEAIFSGRLREDDLAIYLHAPTRTDPTLAPPGGEGVYALVPVPNLAGAVDWPAAGDRLRQRVVQLLATEFGLEDVERHIVVEHRFTPLHFRDTLASHLGAAFSIEPTLFQSAYFRPHNRSAQVRGLYLVGAGTHPGAGVPGVLLSAEITAGLVLQQHGRSARVMVPVAGASSGRGG